MDAIFNTNAVSPLNKREELLVLVAQYQCDIVIVTESLPKNRDILNLETVEMNINSYNMFNTDLSEENVRGTLIYVKRDIYAIGLKLIEYQYIEAVGIKIKDIMTGYSLWSYIGVLTHL